MSRLAMMFLLGTWMLVETAVAAPPVRLFDAAEAPPFQVLKAGEKPPLD